MSDTRENVSRWLPRVLDAGILARPPHWAVFYDLDALYERVADLRAAFPETVLHTIAVKACPLPELLRMAAATQPEARLASPGRGNEAVIGAEAASIVELEIARRAGFDPGRIVYDSPVKTEAEIAAALAAGVRLNADNLDELARIDRALSAGAPRPPSLGVRINPEVGGGRIAATSTATVGSKFGVSLGAARDALLDAFRRFDWLNGVHVHVGSQGCPLELIVEGVARGLAFVRDVEAAHGAGRIRTLDIGGGLPAAYTSAERPPTYAEYAAALRHRCPDLFDGPWQIVTEFGRSIWASTGWAASRVEYVKEAHGRRVALIHFGGDLLPRTVCLPDLWPHELSVFDPQGRPKSGPRVPQDVGGPLCFAGDLVARARLLPRIEPGDTVVAHDVGAYTLSMWSRYNSRLSPPVLVHGGPERVLRVIRPAEETNDLVRFWLGGSSPADASPDDPRPESGDGG